MPDTVQEAVWNELGKAGRLLPVDLQRALEIVADVRKQAEEWEATGIEGATEYYRYRIYALLGRKEEAEACFQRAEEMIPRITNQYDLARMLEFIGFDYSNRNESVRALKYLRQVEPIAQAINRPDLLGKNYKAQSLAYMELGMLKDALEYNFRVLHLHHELHGDPTWLIDQSINIGSTYGRLQDYAKAVESYQRALTLIHEQEAVDRTKLAICLMNLGMVHTLMQRYNDAIPYLHEALNLFEAVGHKMYEAMALSQLGLASLYLDQLDNAVEYYRRGWTSTQAALVKGVVPATILSGMGQVHQRRGELDIALEKYLGAIKICAELGMPDEEMQTQLLLAELYPLLNDYRNAYQHQKRAMELREQILGAEQQRAAAAAELRNERIAAERERDRLNLRAEKAEYEAEFKTKELGMMALQMTQWNAAFRSLRQSVEPYARDGRGQTRAVASSVLKDISTAVESNPGWRVFEEQFERVHSDFIGRLRERSPRLTSMELRICVLIRMELSTAQIADALYLSELTVKKHRTNIRRKLDLHGDDNLNGLLLSL